MVKLSPIIYRYVFVVPMLLSIFKNELEHVKANFRHHLAPPKFMSLFIILLMNIICVHCGKNVSPSSSSSPFCPPSLLTLSEILSYRKFFPTAGWDRKIFMRPSPYMQTRGGWIEGNWILPTGPLLSLIFLNTTAHPSSLPTPFSSPCCVLRTTHHNPLLAFRNKTAIHS